MKLALFVALFVISSGSVFSKRFRDNRVLVVLAAVVAVLSGFAVLQSIYRDFFQISNLTESISESENVAPELPRPSIHETSFGYMLSTSRSEVRIMFPAEAIRFIQSETPDLAYTQIWVILDGFEFRCGQALPSTPSSRDLGMYSLTSYLNRAGCGITLNAEPSDIYLTDGFRLQVTQQNDLSVVVTDRTSISMLADKKGRFAFFGASPDANEVFGQMVRIH